MFLELGMVDNSVRCEVKQMVNRQLMKNGDRLVDQILQTKQKLMVLVVQEVELPLW